MVADGAHDCCKETGEKRLGCAYAGVSNLPPGRHVPMDQRRRGVVPVKPARRAILLHDLVHVEAIPYEVMQAGN